MKKTIGILLIISILIVGCSNKTNPSKSEDKNKVETITITDNRGKQEIPKNAKSIAVLDSRAFAIIADWKVKISAAPKNLIPADNPLKNDESIANIGNHKEPKFETLASVQPDIVIIGQRFAQHYDTIKELLPNTKLIDININLEEKDSKNLVDGLISHTEILGKIFNKEKEANALINQLNESIERLKAINTNGKTFMGVIVSAKNIAYSAPHTGRVWGPIFDILNLKPALEINNASSNHKGDDISVESIAKSNPDVLLILDRDAAIAKEESVPAKDIIEGSNTLKNTKAIKNNKVYYAPNDTYINESIKTFINIFNQLEDFLK